MGIVILLALGLVVSPALYLGSTGKHSQLNTYSGSIRRYFRTSTQRVLKVLNSALREYWKVLLTQYSGTQGILENTPSSALLSEYKEVLKVLLNQFSGNTRKYS